MTAVRTPTPKVHFYVVFLVSQIILVPRLRKNLAFRKIPERSSNYMGLPEKEWTTILIIFAAAVGKKKLMSILNPTSVAV